MKTKFYTYELGRNMRDRDGKELKFAILVHGLDEDIRGHKFNSRTAGSGDRVMYDPNNPFILIPDNLILEAVTVCGGDIIDVSPVIGDFDPSNVDSCNEGINRALTETYKMMVEFDIAHKMYESGDRLSLIGSNDGKKPIRKTYNVSWDDKDTELHIATKEMDLDKAVDELYKHLRPIQTVIGTCYECDAVSINGFSQSISSRLWSLKDDEINENAERLFGLALHRYPSIWDEFAYRHSDIVSDHSERIFKRKVDQDEICADHVSNELRVVIKDSLNKCLKDSVDFIGRQKELMELIDSIDDEEIFKLSKEDYKESLRHIEDRIHAANPSITQDIMTNRIEANINAYRSGGLRSVFPDDEEYYYDV